MALAGRMKGWQTGGVRRPATSLLEFDAMDAANCESGSSDLVTVMSASQCMGRESRSLTEADAVEIWIARWLRIRRKDLMAQYGCDPRRLYEIWWGEKFPASRKIATEAFRARYPGLVERTDFGYRRIPRVPPTTDDGAQGSFFDLLR